MRDARSSVSILLSILVVVPVAWAAHALVLGVDENRDAAPAARSATRTAGGAGPGIDVAVFGFG